MKTLNITFEDEEYDALIKVKKDTPWREFMLQLIKKGDTHDKTDGTVGVEETPGKADPNGIQQTPKA